MDYARKYGKTAEPSSLTEKSAVSFTLRYPTEPSESQNEDKRLVNWKRWLANRKKHHKAYQVALGRSPEQLLLNSGDKYRSIVETREIMEYASDPLSTVNIKKRIDPGFFNSPELLPNHGNPDLPDLQVPPIRNFKSVPKVTHISPPEEILREKGLPPAIIKPLKLKNEYLRMKREELSEDISIIEPNTPELEHLFVRGENFGKNLRERKSTIKRIPVISITDAEETERGTSEWSIDPDAIIAALRINNCDVMRRLNPRFKVTKEEEEEEEEEEDPDSYNWNIKFHSRGSEIVERTIDLENRGNIKISYFWILDTLNLSPFTNKQKIESSFFFNKNNDFILPGQIKNVRIWFRLIEPGIRVEYWKLQTDPKISTREFIIRLWGYSEGEDERIDKTKRIDEFLDEKLRDSDIRDILKEIMINVFNHQPQDPPYKSLIHEKEIFLARNPFHFYHLNLMKGFHKLHKNTLLNDSEWSLSLFDLKKLLLDIQDQETRQTALERFLELSEASLRPSLCNFSNYKNYKKVYKLLCSFFNRFEYESEFVNNICSESHETETEFVVLKKSNESTNQSINKTPSRVSLTIKSGVKEKSKKTRRHSALSESSKEERKTRNRLMKLKRNDNVSLYSNIFHLRILELLGETISQICTAIDSYQNLDELRE